MMKHPVIIALFMMISMTGCQLVATSQFANSDHPTELEIEPIQQTTKPSLQPTATIDAGSAPIIDPTQQEVVRPPEQSNPIAVESVDIDIAQFVIPTCTIQNPHWLNYEVVAGDTLSKIATQFNTDAGTLATVNCLLNINLIYVGQVLKVPPFPPTSTPLIPTLSPTLAVLPSVGGLGEPPHDGCSVVRNIGINEVIIHSVFDSVGSTPVAKLASYLPLRAEASLAYEVYLEGYPDNMGWVWKDHTHLSGTGCQGDIVLPTHLPPVVEPPMNIPSFGHQGEPPVDKCNVMRASGVETAFVYHTPDDFSSLIGKLEGDMWLPLTHKTITGVTVALPSGDLGWMPSQDITMMGSACSIS